MQIANVQGLGFSPGDLNNPALTKFWQDHFFKHRCEVFQTVEAALPRTVFPDMLGLITAVREPPSAEESA